MINIKDLAPLLNPGWVAMNRNGTWEWFEKKPVPINGVWMMDGSRYSYLSTIALDIKEVDDWKESLMKVG